MRKSILNTINNSGLPFIDKYEIIGNVRIMRLKGSIDSETIPAILKIKEQIQKNTDINSLNILIDLKKVTYGDSAALAALIIRVCELKRHDKKLGLVNLPERLQHILEIFRCEKLFLLFDSEEKAVKELG